MQHERIACGYVNVQTFKEGIIVHEPYVMVELILKIQAFLF